MFKRRYTALLTVIPGPTEPPLGCFNRILEPIVTDLQFCEKGYALRLDPFSDDISPVFARVILNISDLPATKKLIGAVGLSSNTHPCHYCNINKNQLNSPDGYDWRRLPKQHDAATLLRANFAYEDTVSDDYAARQDIESTYGVRFSVMMRLI